MIAFIYLNILSLIAHPSSLILHRRFAAGWGGF